MVLLGKSGTRHISSGTHEGKVLIVASVVEKDATRLYYTVKQDRFEDSALQNPGGTGWEPFKEIPLPNDSMGDKSVQEKQAQELTDQNGKYLLRSEYKSAGLTIEARVKYDSFNNWSRILDLGNGAGKQNILLANFGTSKNVVFQINGENQDFTLQSPTELPQGQWVHLAATVQKDGTGKLYINGIEQASGKMVLPQTIARSSNFIGKSNWPDALFQGEMEYVRLWDYALGAEELQASAKGTTVTHDVICAEYSRVRLDPQKRKSVMMLRCLALPTNEGVRLLDEQRIEELEMKWVGNAQIKPTLIGFIEGAPPIPSENLTEEQDYNGATSVELIQSSEVEYSWTREQDVSLGAEASLFAGVESEEEAFTLATTTTIGSVPSGVTASMNIAYHWQNVSTVGASHSLMSSDRLELRGSQEQEANFAHLGLRFIPKNIGYAVVTSGLADGFVSKLRRSGRMIGYQVLPVEGVPMDINTITFLINPAYTMSGSLDGLTGSYTTSNRFFRHVPEMRSQYGSLYPASYNRLKEAYDLKTQIDKQDELHQSYFSQFNAGLVDETSLDRQVNNSKYDGGTTNLNSPDRSGGQNMNKTERGSKGMELHVDLGGVESRGITDFRDYPVLPGEKVDRYRFMSFFLENNVNHWHDFFNTVVDPEWLTSNDEEARALRQTQVALPNKVWRVLHRVTYVERPALMGFGRNVVARDRAADDIRQLRQQVDDLNGRVATMQKEMNDKLDQLLSKKN